MKKKTICYSGAIAAVAAVAAVGCGASYPAPTEHLASSMAAVRTAQETGAANVPKAQLYLKLAEEQTAQAKALIEDGNNERADYMTLRAYNDATLAMAIAKQHAARAQAQQAAEATPTSPSPREATPISPSPR
jgi:uncharacterized protein YqiB (DUF1249 family)